MEAGDGVGGRHDGPDGRWRVGAGCSEGGAAGCGKCFVSLSLTAVSRTYYGFGPDVSLQFFFAQLKFFSLSIDF